MKFDTLYLHVGWSKTGTSAIQSALQNNRNLLSEKGILYPQSIQWADHSHHPFALAFQSSGPYGSNLTTIDAIRKLDQEIIESNLPNTLLSSELSPFYFSDSDFKRFVQDRFTKVKVIFTVRRQSELIISLYNQLIKDPQVRYQDSLFSLTLRNLTWLNFHQNVMRWSNAVGKGNVIVVPYSSNIVTDFIGNFGISIDSSFISGEKIINESLPTRCLALVKNRCRVHSKDADKYKATRDGVVQLSKNIPLEKDTHIIFSASEQNSLDRNYYNANLAVAREFTSSEILFPEKQYSPIKVIPPGIRLEEFKSAADL
ncbi:hypothetical protein QCD60_16815 [Pokkaliibacter sp. MBI-7]|uniref:hypothetical protein n=1 Tax=Pokkaliibacter sp. MBI-7 TaxID=3040600 RepID=UPI002446D13C|nr:hypothetical protein [Pokkaliibacter sp. MBI-7]MDH2434221.1 hypothetical protein [Pokkaliibacter sp. MBI-7]